MSAVIGNERETIRACLLQRSKTCNRQAQRSHTPLQSRSSLNVARSNGGHSSMPSSPITKLRLRSSCDQTPSSQDEEVSRKSSAVSLGEKIASLFSIPTQVNIFSSVRFCIK